MSDVILARSKLTELVFGLSFILDFAGRIYDVPQMIKSAGEGKFFSSFNYAFGTLSGAITLFYTD